MNYYPFGMVMPGRNNTYTSDSYRYAYNGMEQDNEVSGNGNSYTTFFRQYDPRLGRWKSLDPLMAKYPNMSPYVAFNNNPVYFIDPLGLESDPPGGCEGDDGDPPAGGDKTVGQEKNGEFDGTLDQPEMQVSANRTTGEIAQPRPLEKKGNYRLDVTVNGTTVSKEGLSYREAYGGLDAFNRGMEAMRAQQLRDRTFWQTSDWDVGQQTPWRRAFNNSVGLGFNLVLAGTLFGEFLLTPMVETVVSTQGATAFLWRQVNPFQIGKFTVAERGFSGLTNATLQMVGNQGNVGEFDWVSFGTSVGSGNPFIGNGVSSVFKITNNNGIQTLGNGISVQQAVTSFTIGVVSNGFTNGLDLRLPSGGPMSGGTFMKFALETQVGISGILLDKQINK